MHCKSTFLPLLLMLTAAPSFAESSVLTREQQETLTVLSGAISALENFNTLECELLYSFSSESLSENYGGNFILSYTYRRINLDPVYGVQFAGTMRDPDTNERGFEIFDGERLMQREPDGETKVHSRSRVEVAAGAYYIFELRDELSQFCDAILLSHDELAEIYTPFHTWGYVRLEADTVIHGRQCYQVFNTLYNDRDEPDRWIGMDQAIAVDKETMLPVCHLRRYQFSEKGELKVNRTLQISVAHMEVNGPVDDRTFEIPAAEKEGSGEGFCYRWKGEQDVLGRWDADFSYRSLQGKVTVVNLAYLQHGHCHESTMLLDSLARLYAGDDRVRFLYMNPLDTPEQIAEYGRESGISFPMLSVEWDIPNEWEVEDYPFFVIFGPEADVVWELRDYPGAERLAGEIQMYVDSELRRLGK